MEYKKIDNEYVIQYSIGIYDGLDVTIYGYGITERDALDNLFLNINACFWASHWYDNKQGGVVNE